MKRIIKSLDNIIKAATEYDRRTDIWYVIKVFGLTIIALAGIITFCIYYPEIMV